MTKYRSIQKQPTFTISFEAITNARMLEPLCAFLQRISLARSRVASAMIGSCCRIFYAILKSTSQGS